MKIFLALLLLYFCTLAPPLFAATGLDNCTTATVAGGTSLTWSHTVSGTNTLLIVTMHGDSDADAEVSGITYNGVAMTLVQNLLSGSNVGLEVYYKHLGTADGAAHNVVISANHSNTFVGSACSFTGVDSGTPLGTPVTNTADPLTSASVTVPANGMAYEVAVWGHNGDCIAPVAGGSPAQTKQFDACAAGGNNNLGMGSTRTATGVFSWNASNGAYTGAVAIPINASALTTVARKRRPVILQ